MAKDFAGQEVRVRDFVVLPVAMGHGLRFGVVYFADIHEDSISLLATDHRIVHTASTDCIRVSDKLVPGPTRKQLIDGMMGVFHPKETE